MCIRDRYKYLSDILLKEVVAQMEKHSDIMYFPRTILYPYSFNIPTVVSIHDIQQFHYPQFFTRRELKKRKITYGLTAKYSNFIQASSFFIQDDLLKHYPMLNRDQIPVIPEGVNRSTFERKIDFSKIRSKFNLDFQYLFFPAQLWPHKNHMTILKALKHLETEYGKKIHLVLTGARYKNSNVIFKYIDDNEMDYVHYLGKVELEELIGLYQNAKFMITGVLYESSSLPILESAASGTPIIASKTPPNQEMAKVLKINMFDPLDCLELSSLIMNIWGNDEKREDQIVNNLKNINQYSWEIAAEKYIEFFKKCIR